MSKLLVFMAIAAISLQVNADTSDDPICSDIHRVSCTMGDVTDPTGVSKMITAENGALSPESRQETMLNFSTLLKDPANAKLKKTLVKLAPLSDCEKDQAADTCVEALSALLVSKVEARMITGLTSVSLTVGEDSKISELQSILDAPVVVEASKKMVESFKTKSGENDLSIRAANEIFSRVKEAITIQVQDLIGDEKARLLFLERIKAVQWGGSSCGAETLSSLMTPDVFLNPQDNKIYVCRGIARLGTTEYGLAYMMTREMAHFISPCGVTRGKNVPVFKYSTPGKTEASEGEFPFRGVLSCLRGKGSVFAQRGLGLSKDPVAFCDKSDQISESFVDWLAVEAMSDYVGKFLDKHSRKDKKSGIISMMRSQCMPGAGMELADRTPIEERFNRLLLSNPDIREQLGCKVKPLDVAYCAPAPEPSQAAAPEEKQ